ncbi:MAG: hypothetical protein V7K32_02370 [Nostoc sp.]|uniref:hypothetical protein n=1 Tax=Nostoc sp. TaxID=1180 RepID=UPI002FFCD633
MSVLNPPKFCGRKPSPQQHSSLQNVIGNCELVMSVAEVLRIANWFNLVNGGE